MLFVLILSTLSIPSGDPPVAWEFASNADGSGHVVISMTARIDEGWHMYATDLPSKDGPLPTEFRFAGSEHFSVDPIVIEPEPVEQFDPNFAVLVKHHSGTPEFRMKVTRRTSEAFTVKGEVEYMVCNDRTCLPPVIVPFSVEVDAIQEEKE